MTAYEHMTNMCAIGKRNAGFGGDLKAAAYIEKAFNDLRLKQVRRQRFACYGWDFTDCKLAVHHNGQKKIIPSLPCYHSPSTPAGGVHGEYVYLDSPDAPEAAWKKTEAKILIINQEFLESAALYDKFDRYKPAAVLYVCASRSGVFVGTMDRHIVRGRRALPAAGIEYADAAAIAAEGADALNLIIDAAFIENTYSENVLARVETPGAKKNIILGAHFDTIPLPHCATDNTAGMAVILDAAEKLAGCTLKNYNVDLIAFSAEEIDRQGAADYIVKNAEAIKNSVLMIYIDGCGVHIGRNHIRVIGDEKTEKFLQDAADNTGYPVSTSRGVSYLDHGYVASMGVPAAYLFRGHLNDWHTVNDVPENVSAKQLDAMSDYLANAVLALDGLDAYPNWKIDPATLDKLNKDIASFRIK